MKSNNYYIIGGIIFILILCILLFFFFSNREQGLLKIGYNIESVNHGPIMVAYYKRIFEGNNIKVEMIPLQSGKEIQQALAMGKIDVGIAGTTNFLIPISKGAPIRIIAPSTVSPSSVFVNPSSNISNFSNLVGKTVASRVGETSNLALGYALMKENISIKSITFVDIDKSLRPIALMEKHIVDIAVGSEYEKPIYKNYGAIVLEEWSLKGYDKKPFPRTVVAVNTDYFKLNKKTIDKFINSFIESQKFIKDNPEEAALIISNYITEKSDGAINLSADDIKESWKESKYVLWYDPNDLSELLELSKEIGDIEVYLNISQVYDFTYEEVLKNAQKEIYSHN